MSSRALRRTAEARTGKSQGSPAREEIANFFRVIDSARDQAIFRVMYHAGLRASEIGLLDIRDYSPRTERLMVHRVHGSRSGVHPLNHEESRALNMA